MKKFEIKELKINKGMTLLELLVVMLIFAVLVSLGITAIAQFRIGTEFRAATLQFESNIKTVQNLAKNNVVSAIRDQETDVFESQVQAYLLLFNDFDSYEIRSCTYDDAFDLYDCYDNGDAIEPSIPAAQQYISVESASSLGCSGILFKNVSGNISILDQSCSDDVGCLSSINSSDLNGSTCQVSIFHDLDNNRIANYEFSKQTNTFKRLPNQE